MIYSNCCLPHTLTSVWSMNCLFWRFGQYHVGFRPNFRVWSLGFRVQCLLISVESIKVRVNGFRLSEIFVSQYLEV